MTLFWEIFFTIGAIWFLLILFRPRSKEQLENLEETKKHNKKMDKLREERAERWRKTGFRPKDPWRFQTFGEKAFTLVFMVVFITFVLIIINYIIKI